MVKKLPEGPLPFTARICSVHRGSAVRSLESKERFFTSAKNFDTIAYESKRFGGAFS
jgi:hypothetical protein